VAQGGGVPICPECGHWLYFTLRTAGSVTITVDHTYPDTLLGVWVAPGHCTYQMSEARQCSWVVRSFVGEKPRRVVQSFSGGEHTLVIDNVGTHDESVSYQVVFTALASTTAATPMAIARGGPHGPPARN
jgi:hypothetical protein